MVAEKGILDQEEIDRRIVPIIELISVSEVHMAIEKASVETAKVLHHITGEVIYKRWNSVNDERTCPICRLLDGTRVPVGISFIEGLDPEDDTYDIAVNYLLYRRRLLAMPTQDVDVGSPMKKRKLLSNREKAKHTAGHCDS